MREKQKILTTNINFQMENNSLHIEQYNSQHQQMQNQQQQFLQQDHRQAEQHHTSTEDQQHLPASNEPLSSLPQASFNYINSIVGSGVIGIPYAFHRAGFGLGFLLLILVAYITDYSLILMVRITKQIIPTNLPFYFLYLRNLYREIISSVEVVILEGLLGNKLINVIVVL